MMFCKTASRPSPNCVGPEGGGLFEFLTPPPPSGPPKVFEPVFLQIEILGKMGGTAGVENFFAGMRHALKLLNPPVCILKMFISHWGFWGYPPHAWRWGPPRMQGLHSNSALLWAPERFLVPIAGRTQADDTLSIRLGAVSQATWAAYPTVRRCLNPAPPLHTPWEPPPPPGTPPGALPNPPPQQPPPPLHTPKSFRTRLGCRIRTGRPPPLAHRLLAHFLLAPLFVGPQFCRPIFCHQRSNFRP